MPDSPEFRRLAQSWNEDAYALMLGWVWAGYDLLKAGILQKVDWTKAKDDMEREVTQLLAPRIRQCMPSETFCYLEHAPKERETRKPPPAQPPEYDLAFVLYANERIMWPMEAKVLSTDRDTSAYVKDILAEFLTCRYAPFSDGGAMLGYLLSGHPSSAYAKIAEELGVTLVDQPNFPGRNHRTSRHFRKVPNGKSYPRNFLCHHLLMPLK